MSKAEVVFLETWGRRPLLQQVNYSDLVPPDDFSAKKKWRFDFQVPNTKLLIEIQGSGYGHGGSSSSHTNDIAKYRSAVMAGYTILFLNAAETLNRPDLAVEYVEDALEAHGYGRN